MDKPADPRPNRAQTAPSRRSESEPVQVSGERRMAQIQNDIEKTREETIRTLTELERRLSPSRLMAQFKGLIKEKTRQATSGRTNAMAQQTTETSKRWGTAFFDAIKSNPIPTMMVGGGLAWLIASGVRSEDMQEEPETGFVERRKSIGTDETGTYGLGFIDRRRSSSSVEQARSKASQKTAEAKSTVGSKAEEARSKASQISEQMRAKASQTSEQVRLKAQELGISVAEYRRRAQDRLAQSGQSARSGFMHSLENNPLAVAGVMMAAGTVIGLLMPGSRYEAEKLGPQRDEMLERAREAGREKVEQIGAVAREAKESAKEEAERQGVMSRETSEEIERKAGELGEDIESRSKEERSETPEGFGSPSEQK